MTPRREPTRWQIARWTVGLVIALTLLTVYAHTLGGDPR